MDHRQLPDNEVLKLEYYFGYPRVQSTSTDALEESGIQRLGFFDAVGVRVDVAFIVAEITWFRVVARLRSRRLGPPLVLV